MDTFHTARIYVIMSDGVEAQHGFFSDIYACVFLRRTRLSTASAASAESNICKRARIVTLDQQSIMS
jgi:hypothetical protein